jgi:fatty acid desaturase
MTTQSITATETDARVQAFGRALDDLREEIESRIGAEDAEHIQRIDRLSRRLELLGRGLIYVSFEPILFGAGSCVLWVHKLLELMEIGHMALHGAYDGLNGAERFQSDVFQWRTPIDESGWKIGHNHRHHQYTNTAGKDPDLDFGPLRLSAAIPYRLPHSLQPVSNALSWFAFSTAINLHVTGVLEHHFGAGAAGDRRPNNPDAFVAWRTFFRKAARYYAKEFVLLPLLAGLFAPKVLLANLLTDVARDVWAAAIIYCGHVGTREFAPDTQAEDRAHWYAMQAEAARDVKLPKPLSILSGALDYQIEHHLFPRMPPNRLRQIAPRVRAICEAHGVRYRSDSWPHALVDVLRELRRVAARDAVFAA